MTNLADKLTLEEFNKRFTKEHQGYTDNMTGKIVFCPHSLGFKIDQQDCLESRSCKKCWHEIEKYLKFRGGRRNRFNGQQQDLRQKYELGGNKMAKNVDLRCLNKECSFCENDMCTYCDEALPYERPCYIDTGYFENDEE